MAEIIAGVIVLICGVFDVFARTKSRQNRFDRHTAIKAGSSPPEKEAWTWIYQVLTPLLLLAAVFWIFDRLLK